MEKEINYFVITNDENEVLAVIDLVADEVIESDGIVVHEMNCDDAEFSESENGDIFLCEGSSPTVDIEIDFDAVADEMTEKLGDIIKNNLKVSINQDGE